MKCPECNGIAKRRGFYTNKNFKVQRYQCLDCNHSFSEKLPLDNLRVDFKQACQVLNLLTEGVGIRATSRLLSIHQQTVLNVLARAGSKAGRFLDASVVNLKTQSVEADEMFCFVACKERNNLPKSPFRGEQYLGLAIDSKSKLIISHVLGKRLVEHTRQLLGDLRQRIPDNFQISTDGFEAYRYSVPQMLGKEVHFAQVVKIFAADLRDRDNERKYSPSHCVGTRIHVRRGKPDPELISTSYVERTNLTVRTFNRRFTRLCLGYSKKIEYLRHSINLMIFHFNFCRIHGSLNKQTPAMAAGLTDHPWTFDEMLRA